MPAVDEIVSVQTTCEVVAVDFLRPDAFVLRVARGGFSFIPGQHVTLGLRDEGINREYSIYSGVNDECLEFLVRVHPGSHSAEILGAATPGTLLSLAGPYGACTLPPAFDPTTPVWFIAAGVGIAPFRSIIRSVAGLDYHLLHGVRCLADAYGREEYPSHRHIACTSRERTGGCHGRVTDWLTENRLPHNALVFVCGHANMVADTYEAVRRQGIPSNQLLTEVFF